MLRIFWNRFCLLNCSSMFSIKNTY